MRLSVSLPESDVEFLDTLTSEHGLPSRSAALTKALRVYRELQLGDAYEKAWKEWEESGEADLRDSTAADGLDDESW